MESQKRTHHGKLKPLANSFSLVYTGKLKITTLSDYH